MSDTPVDDSSRTDRTDDASTAPADDASTPKRVDDLLSASPSTAYFWGRVAGDGDVERECVTVRTGDEVAADALAAITGTDEAAHEVSAGRSAHDASIVRYEDEYELQVFGAPAARASAAFGLPIDGQPGGYRFDAFSEHRRQLLRGLLEATGTVCFRESAGTVGISFVHDDEALLATIDTLLGSAEPHVATDEHSETSSGGYWFGLADDTDVDAFAEWIYAGSESSGLYAADRRAKLRRSVERATDGEVGSLSE